MGVFGSAVGQSKFDLNVDMDWGRGIVFSGARDEIGFQASTHIYVDGGAAKRVDFAVSSNNGHRLRVDGTRVLDSWDRMVRGGGYRSNKVALVLQPGKHELGLDFYEWDDQASFSFSVSPDEVSFWCMGNAGPNSTKDPTWSRWSVDWYTVVYDAGGQDKYRFTDFIKNDDFSAEFDKNWGSGSLVEGKTNYVGFQAKTTVDIHGNGPQKVVFTLGSDDGSTLHVDGKLTINNWGAHSYYSRSASVTLNPGLHDLTLKYFDWTSRARVRFNATPSNIFASCR